MATLNEFLRQATGIIWGWPMVVMLAGTGLYLTFLLRFLQIRFFTHAVRVIMGKFDNPEDAGDINHFQALASALSATIGIGNIAGVATAVHWAGPGALFWMWVSAFLGMATKFTTCTLGHKYRVIHEDGSASGGPMYAIERGMGPRWRPLAMLFATLTVITSFATPCMVQSNTVAVTLKRDFDIPLFVSGLVMAALVALVILGGIRRIGKVASKLVPFMASLYILGSIVILAVHWAEIPAAFATVFSEAFTPTAQIGGFFGSAWMAALTWGIKRGLYSNEAGLGSAPIAHAAAKTKEPVREGLVAMTGPFIDTIVLCTLTGLVIVTTGVWHEKFPREYEGVSLAELTVYEGELTPENYSGNAPYSGEIDVQEGKLAGDYAIFHETGTVDNVRVHVMRGIETFEAYSGSIQISDGEIAGTGAEGRELAVLGDAAITGAELTAQGFSRGLPGKWGNYIVSIGIGLFAFSTALVWSYYGDRSIEYLVGPKGIIPYRCVFVGALFLGSILALNTVWRIGDVAMGLMALPNLVATIALSVRVAGWTRTYESMDYTKPGKVVPE